MAETVYLSGGGGPIPHDLPLHWAIREQLDKGLIVRVNADGSTWTPEPEKPTRSRAKQTN